MTCVLCGGNRAAGAAAGAGLLRCPDCGLMFREPYRGCAASRCADCSDRCIDRLSDPGFLAARIRVDSRRAGRIDSLTGGLRRLRVLEIGAGLGCLSARLKEAAAEYAGLESSPVFHSLIAENFPQLAPCVENSVLPGPEHRGRYDLLVMVDVLQFAPKPLEYLREAALALAPGGRIYIEVPDESMLPFRSAVRRALGLYRGSPVHHGHINLFTPRALRRLLRDAGFAPRVMTRASIAADEDRLFLTIKRPLPAWLRALSLTARLTRADSLLGLGNSVCLAGRRR